MLALLHLCDSLFPIGSFGYSDGLETACHSGAIQDRDALGTWLDVCLDETFVRADGPAVVRGWTVFSESDWPALVALDAEVIALRPSSAARRSSRAMGRRLLTTWHALHPDPRLQHVLDLVGQGALGPALPTAFAGACATAGIDRRAAAEAFAYTRLAATISAAMRLVAIGQGDAHAALAKTLERVPGAVDRTLAGDLQIESFTPAMDIAQMTQQYMHSRLFRS